MPDAPPAGDARELVRPAIERMRARLREGAPLDVVTRILGPALDDEELASRALGSPCPRTARSCTNHWDGLTGEQRAEIAALLRKLVEQNIVKNLRSTLDGDIAYASPKELGDGSSSTRTEARSTGAPSAPAVQVDYVVLRSSRGSRLIDVVTEGASMTKSYYDQFHRMLTTPDQGYPFLIAKLRAKVARR